jgi:hypothetical protein
MYKFLIFLLIVTLPMIAFANETKTSQLFVERYDADARSKKFTTLVSAEKEISSMKTPYSDIITSLQKSLKTTPSLNQKQADYHVVFVNIPYTYAKEWAGKKLDVPDIDPVLPKNKYEDNSITPYRFSSPWIRGTLYIKDGRPVGGTIIIPVSRFARIDELYNAAHQKWDAISSKDSTILNEVSLPYETVYKPTLELYDKMFLHGSEERPTEKHLEKIFAPKGKAALTLARLARISSQSTLGPFELEVSHKWEKCINHSESFYISIYEYLFIQLFEKTVFTIDDRSVHDITPPKETLQFLYEAAGNYNYFSPNFKENSQ